jgi:hypothetical protein
LLYGPLSDGEPLGTPDAGLDHFRMTPAPTPDPWDVDLYWILDRVVELVTARGYPIVNLSLGPELPSTTKPSRTPGRPSSTSWPSSGACCSSPP